MTDDPAQELASKLASRAQLGSFTRFSLPGDRLLQNAVRWGKKNRADLTQSASNLQIRWTNQGHQFPPPLGTVPEARWFGAGFTDYAWLFATDGEYTAFAAVERAVTLRRPRCVTWEIGARDAPDAMKALQTAARKLKVPYAGGGVPEPRSSAAPSSQSTWPLDPARRC